MDSPAHPSLTDIAEPQLVTRLMSDPMTRSRWLSIKGFPRPAVYRCNVSLKGLPGDPKGDIDILIAKQDEPSDTVAIQVKRIKIMLDDTGHAQPNKLGEFQVGVRQANLLAELRFAQVYLWVIVVVDARRQNGGRITFDGASPQLRSMVNAVISTTTMRHEVGLDYFELTQPMDFEPLSTGSTASSLVRLASPVAQPNEVTNWVVNAIAHPETDAV